MNEHARDATIIAFIFLGFVSMTGCAAYRTKLHHDFKMTCFEKGGDLVRDGDLSTCTYPHLIGPNASQ